MKKLFLFIAMLSFTAVAQAQSDPVEEMFNKYSERDGFTVISISGRMFSMFQNQESENKNADDVINRLKSIKVLSVEDSLLNKNLNFYTELSKKMNLSVYEELMVVKDSRNITRFLIKQKGDIISELLVIVGGPAGNSLISIKGDLNLKSISEISKTVGMQELESLKNIEDKSPEK